jgi:trimethylamine--corrinoid protein Co-methyltransferase
MILDRDACARIHGAALDVLATTGVRVDDDGIVSQLLEAGARAIGDHVVSIGADMVAATLGQAPRTARIADRRGRVWEIGPGGPALVFTGNALYVVRGAERREMTRADLADLARVVEACPHVHGMVGTSLADVTPRARDFAGVRVMASHTTRHLRPCIYTPEGAGLVVEMAQVLAGTAARLADAPVVSTGFSILSPLHWSSLALAVFRATAGHGIPVMINSEPMAGATAPVTLAGALVVADADVLSGLVINQLLEPGRPCIYNAGFAHVMDMSSGLALTGSPENALLHAAAADMARFHGLPSAAWMSTEAMTADAQAAFEKTTTGLAHAAAGVNVIWGAGNLESTLAMSPDALVIDDEIASYFLRFRDGIPVDDASLAVDAIREVGLRGNHLGHRLTLARHREVLSRAALAFRGRREGWEAAGALSLEQAARERVGRILAEPAVPCLDEHQARELARIEAAGLAASWCQPA